MSALVGLAGLVGGTFAVFESGNQAGSVAMLTIGAVSGLFALLGKIPLRWVLAGAEVDMTYDETKETAEALSEVLTADQLDSLATRLMQDPLSDRSAWPGRARLVTSVSEAARVEREGNSRIARAIAGAAFWRYTEQTGADMGADGVAIGEDGTRIAVAFKAWGPAGPERLARVKKFLPQIPAILAHSGCVALLVMTDDPAPTRKTPQWTKQASSPVRVVSFGDSSGRIDKTLMELRDLAREAVDSSAEVT